MNGPSPVLRHKEGGKMVDRWGRPVRSGPVDPRWLDAHDGYPCDDSSAPDGCRLWEGHMGPCLPTPEDVDLWVYES